MNKSESRYFATAARMDEAFLTLLAKKDFEYITVKEICEVAGAIIPPSTCTMKRCQTSITYVTGVIQQCVKMPQSETTNAV